jgi:hypothetical protein
MSWANAYSWQYRSEGIAMALHDFQSSRSWEGAASEGVFSGLVLSFLRSSGEKLSSLALLFVAVLVMMATPGLSQAAGFALIQQGTAAMAQGNAFVAEANDPSAIFYNPAGLNQLKRPEIYINTTYNVPDREFHGPNGEFAQTNHRLFRTPSIYLVYPFHDRIAAGIGFEAAEFTAKWGRSSGYGLFSIRERLNHLGGFLEVASKPGQGTSATIMVPLEQSSMLSN